MDSVFVGYCVFFSFSILHVDDCKPTLDIVFVKESLFKYNFYSLEFFKKLFELLL